VKRNRGGGLTGPRPFTEADMDFMLMLNVAGGILIAWIVIKILTLIF
jgi:hypothetical protein